MSRISQFMISVSAGLLVLAFQNCSPTGARSSWEKTKPPVTSSQSLRANRNF